MNNLSKFTAEVLFTTVVASIVSLVLALVMTWLLSLANVTTDVLPYVYFVTGILFGLMVGYKLRNIVEFKPAKAAKKKKK